MTHMYSNSLHCFKVEENQGTDTATGEAANSGSIFLMIFINFLSNVVFSIVLPSLPDFIKDVGGADYLNGWAVAANSLGTFIASPLFGLWADRRNFREVFVFSLLLMVLANIW
jgi:MFS family permease